MKRVHIYAAVAAGLMAVHATAWAGGIWTTDFESARTEAARRGVPILADFSGSDWCHWCVRLDNEVFSQEAFQSFAAENFVLFLADFPQSKEQAKDVQKQNRALLERYGVQGFPTVLLLDSKGDVLAKTGYRRGGPAAYVKHLQDLLAGPSA